MESNSNEIVVGLDIGTTKICAIVGRKTDQSKLEIMGMGKAQSEGVTRGVVSNIEKTVQGIREAIAQAEETAKVTIRIVNVGIAGQHIRSFQYPNSIMRNSSEEEINKSDIELLVEGMYKLALPPGEQIIHILPQDYMVDNEQGIIDPIGMCGGRIGANFHIITGQVAAANNIIKCIKKSKLEPVDIILEPLASADSVLSNEEKEAGVVLVDIGGGTTDIAIFHEGIIRHTAVIPFGGNSITEDIREGCTVMKHQAELLKVKFGSALADENQENEIISIPGLRDRAPKEISVKNLAFIIQARMEEIIEQVKYEIHCSGFEKKLIAGIVVTGGGAQLKHLTQLVEYITGMDCRVGYPNEHIAKTSVDEVKSPMYATCVGLVMKGIQKADLEKTTKIIYTAEEEIEEKEVKQRGKFFDFLLKKGEEFFKSDFKERDDKDFL